MGLTPLAALTAQQVHSWPAKPTPQLGIEGNVIPTQTPEERKQAFLQLARDRFTLSRNASELQRQEMMEDFNFYCPQDEAGQWDPVARASRVQQDRPVLTLNRMPQFVGHVANNMRQARPAIKIVPVGDPGANDDMAEVKQGIVRYIEQNSRADIPYDTSFESMCIMGLGWIRVVDDWAAADSFDKDLYIRWVKNTFSVYWDPFCQQPDWSDMKFAFVVEDLTRREFIAKYGKNHDAVDDQLFKGIGDHSGEWFAGGKIRVAEYFYVDYDDDILCEMPDKTTRYYSELRKAADGERYSIAPNEDGDKILYYDEDPIGRTRDAKRPVVKWALITGLDILQERTWKGKHIPLIPVIGNQIQKNGQTIIVGMVRYAREPQRMYNYAYSQFVETVALAPRAPFIAEVDQVPDGLVEEWRDANKQPTAVLRYKSKTSAGGQLEPPPQRQQAEPPIAALVQLLNLCDNMMKSVFSIYDSSLGQRGPQESGMAINARKIESDNGTYNWGDNFIRSLRYLGIVLEDLTPHYYNTPGRVLQITQEDTTMRKLVMNEPFEEDGVTKHFDLSKGGKYTAIASTGPSYQTQRQEAASSMMELYKADPNLLAISADLFVENLDFPGKEAIVSRIRQSLPPALQPKNNGNGPPVPPQLQAALQALQAQNQQLTQALHEALDKKETEKMKQEYETLRTQMHEEVSLAAAELKASTAQSQFLSEKVFEELNFQRQMLQQALGQTPQPSSGNAPAPAAPAAPSLAGPPNVGAGNPTVGG
jgi:hypothetical protein